MRHWYLPTLIGVAACIAPSVIALDPFGNSFFFDVPPFGEQGRIPSISDKEYYDRLGLDPGANEAAIKRSYRKLAVKNHPDKGGNPNKFKELAEAYEVLSNPEKRRAYDMYGKAGVEAGAAGFEGFPTNAEDILSAMFGSMGGSSGRGRKYSYGSMRARDQVYEVEVPLPSMYTGASQKIRMALSKPQMDSQMHKDIDLRIPKGARSGTRVVIPGMVDPGIANVAPGDLVFILKESTSLDVQRFGDHLLMDVKLSLAEALTGFERKLGLMDGSETLVKLKEKDVITPGCLRRIRGKGMPDDGNPEQTGDLYLRFEVIFPTPKEVDELGENWRDEIRTLLGYEGSGDQLLGRAAASIDSKLGHGGRKNSSVDHNSSSPPPSERTCSILQPPDREFERKLRFLNQRNNNENIPHERWQYDDGSGRTGHFFPFFGL